MPRFLDDNDTDYDLHADRFGEQQDEPADVRCSRCGADGLHWQRVTQADGMSEKPVLFTEDMRRHVCAPSSDDFEAAP